MGVSSATIGAVMAGGRSTRYGSPKALAQLAGRRVIDRVAHALRAALPVDTDVICIVNDAALAREIGLPARGDVLPGNGALGGVHAALVWARELGAHGVLAVGCDMPLLDPRLLAALLERAADSDAVLPESMGPRGVEPLCAWYGTGCIAAIETAIDAGDRRMIGFLEHVRATRLPLGAVREFGEPAELFMNLNSPADRDAAERLLVERTR